MENKIYIPTKIKVGYQKRLDTYTKKLAYVVYIDDKGKLRKEASWKGWIDKKQGIDDFENVPTEGFVLNRNVGGAKESYGWDVRIEKVRVYDPRGFEFEIDLPNVLFILQECTSTKGKGLEGTFVYGWKGPNLILLPTSCNEYKKSKEFTDMQSAKVSTKDLIIGASYKTKKQQDLIYMGKFNWVEQKVNRNDGGYKWSNEEKYIFLDSNAHINSEDKIELSQFNSEKEYEQELKYRAKEIEQAIKNGDNFKFIPMVGAANLAFCNSETPVSNYADLLTLFNKSINASKPTEFVEKTIIPKPELKKAAYGGWLNKDKNKYFLKNGTNYISVDIGPKDKWSRSGDDLKPNLWEINYEQEISFDKNGLKIAYSEGMKKLKESYSASEIKDLGLIKLCLKLDNNELVNAEKYL